MPKNVLGYYFAENNLEIKPFGHELDWERADVRATLAGLVTLGSQFRTPGLSLGLTSSPVLLHQSLGLDS